MPEISRFYGIVIKMLYEAGGKHNKPHVHVEYGEYEASVGIDGEVLAGICQKINTDWFLHGLYYMKKNCMKHGIMLCR